MFVRDVVWTPFFIAKLFSRWDASSAPAPGRCCVLERLQSLVSGPKSPRTNDEEDNLVFISLLRAASTLGPSGGSNFLLYALRILPLREDTLLYRQQTLIALDVDQGVTNEATVLYVTPTLRTSCVPTEYLALCRYAVRYIRHRGER